MADQDTFRPQPDDAGSPPTPEAAENQQKMANIDAVRAAASGDGSHEKLSEGAGAGSFEMQGNMPPEMMQAMKQAESAKGGGSTAPKRGFGDMNKTKQRSKKKEKGDGTFVQQHGGSDHLKELLAGLKGSTSIYETLELPSRGRFYDGEDGPADGVVSIRPMTGEEEQILATPRFVRKGQAINMIFQRCMEQDYNPDQFLTVDRTYLLIYLRGISYSPEYDVEVKCPDTEKKFSTTIDLNSLYVESCPDSFGPVLEDVLPTSGYKFKYTLSRGKDEREIQDYRERRIKMFGDGSADDTLIYRTSMLLDNVEGLQDQRELQTLLKGLPINDVAYIRGSINEPPFGVETSVTIVSPFTMEEFEIELPLEANFFFPRRKKTDDTQA
jgi:hypothetical protein